MNSRRLKFRTQAGGAVLAVGLLLLFCVAVTLAGPRSSANYSITADGVDYGGCRVTSAAYDIADSVGGICGISTNVGSSRTAQAGYIAQVNEEQVKTIFIFR